MPAADQANASQADPPGLTVSVSVSASQHLIIEVLRRPVEFTLRAAIAVVHKARERIAAARVDRLFPRVEDEGGAQRGGLPPADDAPREHIDDEGDIDEPGPGRHVGEVRHPQLIRSRGRALPMALSG